MDRLGGKEVKKYLENRNRMKMRLEIQNWRFRFLFNRYNFCAILNITIMISIQQRFVCQAFLYIIHTSINYEYENYFTMVIYKVIGRPIVKMIYHIVYVSSYMIQHIFIGYFCFCFFLFFSIHYTIR